MGFSAKQHATDSGFHWQTIRYSGVPFEGSPQHMFWNGFIDPFLEAQITEGFEIALDHAQKRGVDATSCLLVARNELCDGITSIYQRMQDIDRRLRGRGNPLSVQPRDVKPAILAMHEKVTNYYASAEKSIHRSAQAARPGFADALELKPGIAGFSIDLKKLWTILRRLIPNKAG